MDVYTPSSNPHDSSSTSVPTTQATRGSTASTSNLSTDTCDAQSSTFLSGATASTKRQRGRRVVTANACTECREKRAKCDGQQPCRRCSAQEVECHYKAPVRQSKMNLRNTIEQLRRQQASNDLVINTLSYSRKWKEVLCQLRSGRSVEAIADWLVSKQLSSSAAGIPSLSNLSGPDAKLTNLALLAGVGDALYTPEISDGAVSASTGSSSSMSPDSLLGSTYSMDSNSQWSQYLDAGQAHSSRSNSQPATDISQLFNPSVNASDLVTFWADSVPLPVPPPPPNSMVTSSGSSVDSSLFWPFQMQGQPIMPTGDAFGGAGFDMI